MAKDSSDLFNKRSTTHEFLFSHSDESVDRTLADTTLPAGDDAGTMALSADFDDIRDREGLVQTIQNEMASAPSLFAVAVHFEWAAGLQNDEDGGEASTIAKSLTPLATTCRSLEGCWARIGRDRFVCVIPRLSAEDGQQTAQLLLNTFEANQCPPVTVATAVYPTLDFTREQIVENAEKALEHGGFLGPGTITEFDAVSLNISGDRHYQAGNLTRAIDEYRLGLQLDPDDANLHNSLGVCYGVQSRQKDALAAFENAVRLDPQDVMAIYNTGFIHFQKQAYEKALDYFRQADQLEPGVFEVVYHIGLTLLKTKMPGKARPYLETAAQANDHSCHAFKSLGECLAQLDFYREAIQAYKQVVKKNPTDAESLSSLGQLYLQIGESLDVATVFAEQSIQLSPDNGLFRHRLGRIYLQQGKPDRALAFFEQAIAMGHDSHIDMEVAKAQADAVKAS